MYALIGSNISGLFFRFHYLEQVDWSQAFIVCANHTSNLDINILTVLIKGNFAFMGKEELKHKPITSLFFKTIDIPINRDQKISSYRGFKKAGEYLDKGMSVVMFPEGLIDEHYPPRLSEFKNGPFRLAIEKKIPILPITVCNAWQLMWDDGSKMGSKPGIVDIIVHPVIAVDAMPLEDAEALKLRVFSVINKELE